MRMIFWGKDGEKSFDSGGPDSQCTARPDKAHDRGMILCRKGPALNRMPVL